MRLPASLKGEYERLNAERSPYLQRAREAAKYTLPTLLPMAGKTAGAKLRTGYSNFGARCVNSLASKMLLAGLPARQSFFRFVADDQLLAQLGGEKARGDIEKALFAMEAIVQSDIETTPTRTPVGEGIKHMLIAGNVMLYMLPTGGIKCYPLHSYVVMRDESGNVLRHVTEDRVSPMTLPDTIRGSVMAKMAARNGQVDKTVCIYTGCFRNGNHWQVWQEVEGIRVPESEGTYPLDASPWLPLRWTPVDGESYGRGMVEDYLGYFTSLEALTAALVKGTAIAAKVVFVRNPNGTTTAAALTKSETGDVIVGNVTGGVPTDVAALQVGKAVDFSTARQMIADLKDELSFAFAMNQAVQRQAERVTAEEIRFMAQELDSLLGGNYSTFALEFQNPFLRRKVLELEKAGKLPRLPKKSLKPVIVTGLDALGRGAELDNLRALVKDIVDLGGPDALETYVHFDDLLTRLSTARGLKTDGLIKSKQEVDAARQEKAQAAMVQQLGPNAVNQMGQIAKQQMAPQGTP